MIDRLKPQYIDRVVKIHRQELSGFLSELGEKFLKKFYKASLDIPEMFTFVEKQDEQILGFISGVASPRGLYKKIFFKDIFSFVWIILGIFIVHPLKIIRMVKILAYPGFSSDSPELLSIAVIGKHQKKGIGRRLFMKAVKEFKKRLYTDSFTLKESFPPSPRLRRTSRTPSRCFKEKGLFRVSVYAGLSANKFYEKMDCRFLKSFDFLGEKMNYYSYGRKKE